MLGRYILNRMLLALPVLLGITLLAFLLGVLSPGDPAEIALSSGGESVITDDQIAQMRHRMGLDRSYPVQYLIWLRNILQGNWGTSYRTQNPVWDEISSRLGVTMGLACFAMVLTVLVGVTLGIIAAARNRRISDQVIQFVSVLLLSLPGFWVAILLIFVFAELLSWLPTSGQGGLKYMLLPSLVLALSSMGTTIRLTRSSMLQELAKQYITAARGKGISQGLILMRHAFANSIVPVLTLLGNYFGGLLGGAVIVESIFAINGLGKFALDSISVRDYPALQGYVIITGAVFVTVHLLLDLTCYVINPQIRLGSGAAR